MAKKMICYSVSKPKKDIEWNEYVIVVKKNGKRDEAKTGYESDKESAWASYKEQVKWAKKHSTKGCRGK